MWSCGVLCFLLLRGRHPFQGANDDAIAKAIKTHEGYSASYSQPELENGIQRGVVVVVGGVYACYFFVAVFEIVQCRCALRILPFKFFFLTNKK
jgi:serine/threonine protein kinase